MATKGIGQLPSKVAYANQKGVNDALRLIVSDEARLKSAVALLEENPKAVIQRLFTLQPNQRLRLKTMSDDEIKTIVSPVVKAIKSGRKDFRLVYTEEPDPDPAFKYKLKLELEFQS